MIAYVDRGEGIVLLTNGGQGRRLMDEVVRAVATDYGWPDIAPPSVEEKPLTLAERAKCAGAFAGGGLSVVLEARPDGLFANTGGPQPERLLALSATRFRSEGMGVTVQFVPDYSSFDVVEGGPPIKFHRAEPDTRTQ